jgi:hypothetical protein
VADSGDVGLYTSLAIDSANGASFFIISSSEGEQRNARANDRAESPECDGIRRCQRLPELTHPVDSARLRPDTSKDVPRRRGGFSRKLRPYASVAGDALTCAKDVPSPGSGGEVPEPCFAEAAAQGRWAVEVAGGVSEKAGVSSYTLSIDYRPAPFGPSADRVEIWAEPSHTPLLIGVKSPDLVAESRGLGTEPLAVVRGLEGPFSQKLTLAYSPSKGRLDRRIVVKMRVGNQDLLIASADVNVKNFRFTSTFDLVTNPGGVYAVGSYHHCCGGARCTRMCADCNTAFFTCDLVLCEINCDSPF